jgi:hypothetical protein
LDKVVPSLALARLWALQNRRADVPPLDENAAERKVRKSGEAKY